MFAIAEEHSEENRTSFNVKGKRKYNRDSIERLNKQVEGNYDA
jgi:hypothetical protein